MLLIVEDFYLFLVPKPLPLLSQYYLVYLQQRNLYVVIPQIDIQ